MKLGVIGCGRVATLIHLPSLEKISGCEVVALTDIDEDRLNEAAEKFCVDEKYTDCHAMLEKADLDAVFVCSPPETHFQMVMDSIRHGKHVLCEKPLTMTVEEGLAVKEALEKWRIKTSKPLVVMPAHNFIFTPCFMEVLNVLKSGLMGKLCEIRCCVTSNLKFYKPKTDFRSLARGGVIEDQLPHAIYLYQTVAGPAQKISLIKPKAKRHVAIDDVTVEAELADGVSAEMVAGWASFVPSLQLDLVGDSGQLKTDVLRNPYNLTIIKEGKAETLNMGRRLRQYLDVLRSRHPSYALEHSHFIDCVEGKAHPRITVDDGIKLVTDLNRIIDALEKSPRSSRVQEEKIALLRVEGNVERTVQRSIDLLGGLNVNEDDTVVIKPNVCYPRNIDEMILTDPRILEAVINIAKQKTRKVVVVESDSVSGTADKRMKKSGVIEVIERCGVDFLNLSEDETEEHGFAGFKILIPKTVVEADYLINLPKIKTHGSALISIAMKNMFGALANKKKSTFHSRLSDILVYVNRAIRQDLIVVDGIVGMEGLGPINGSPVKLGLMVAGLNPVTVDAACCNVMGINPYAVEPLWKAYKLGMGEINLEKVQVLGENVDDVKTKFSLPVYSPKNLLSSAKAFLMTHLGR